MALGFPGIQRRVLGFPAGAAAAAGVPGAAAAAPPPSPSPNPSPSPGSVQPPAVAALAEVGQKQQLVQGLEARMQAFLAQRDIARLLEGVTPPHFSGFCKVQQCGGGRELAARLQTGCGPPAAQPKCGNECRQFCCAQTADPFHLGRQTFAATYHIDSVHDAVQARALAATGMVPAAMRWLRHIKMLDPANAEAVFATGMLHVHQQAWPEAEQASVFCTATCLSSNTNSAGI